MAALWRPSLVGLRQQWIASAGQLTSLSLNGARKWLNAAVAKEPRYRRSEAPGKLTPFHASIRQALKVDAHRPQ